jgi:hypothetical protein
MRGQKKKNQRKWENSEEYLKSKKEKEYLNKYKNIAGEYLEDWEFIELFQKFNYEDEQISKELNKIKLGDEFKWKEIKNGKPVTTRSTDQIRKKKNYYRPEKSYQSYEKSEEEINEPNNKRKGKGSYHKYYVNKKPKRPFQKCYEVPSDYHAPNKTQDDAQDSNQNNNQNNDNNNGDNNNNNSSNNVNNNISENSEKENLKPKNNDNLDENNKKNIKKNLGINKKEEEKKNNEDKNETEEEEQKKIILLKGNVFNSLKRVKNNTDVKNKEIIKKIEIYNNNKENNEDNNKAPGPEINLTQDPKKRKELQKKYFRDLVGHMKHYSKKMENNIKRASSKDSETSDDRSPETIKKRKRNNIPTSSSTMIQKKKIIINNNNEINRNLRKAYEIDQNEIEFESKVANFSINSCYDNPMRDQYLKIINEKRKQNPGKIVEFIIPQFNPFMPPYPSPYQYNPYINQNMYMYPQQYPIQGSMVNQQMNLPMNPQINMQLNPQLNQQMNMQFNPQINPNLNMQLNSKINPNMHFQAKQQINSPINSPVNSQLNLQLSPQINQSINYKNNYIAMNNPELLSPQSNNAPNPELINNNSSDN